MFRPGGSTVGWIMWPSVPDCPSAWLDPSIQDWASKQLNWGTSGPADTPLDPTGMGWGKQHMGSGWCMIRLVAHSWIEPA